jgi:hypothetical protein
MGVTVPDLGGVRMMPGGVILPRFTPVGVTDWVENLYEIVEK